MTSVRARRNRSAMIPNRMPPSAHPTRERPRMRPPCEPISAVVACLPSSSCKAGVSTKLYMDATIYNLVLTPALQELLGKQATTAEIGSHGGLILGLSLVGWALGGILFGIMADRFRRARTLVITILVYA